MATTQTDVTRGWWEVATPSQRKAIRRETGWGCFAIVHAERWTHGDMCLTTTHGHFRRTFSVTPRGRVREL